jgi:hypothetical protein
VVVAMVAGSTGAIASQLITSKDIQNGTIKPVDLNKKLLKKINSGGKLAALTPGSTGSTGSTGATGAAGSPGSAGAEGAAGAEGLDSGDPRPVVTGDLQGWTLADYGDNSVVNGAGSEDATPNGSLTFTTPPAPSALGSKALEMLSFNSAAATDNGRTVVAYLPFPGSDTASQTDNPFLRELTTATYSSLIHTQPQANLDVAWKMEVLGANACAASNSACAVGSASGYTTVVYEPVYNNGSQTLNEWHRHSVRAGKIWVSKQVPGSSECTQASPCTLGKYMELSPNAVVQTIKLVIGQNSGAAWPGWDGFVDDVHLGFDGDFTGYDLGG